MNKTLIIAATHGDEIIGVQALQELEKYTDSFDWIIGNEKAYEKNTRCFEGDLNRSAPGVFGASQYASRRAAEIIGLSQNYTYTIDLHGTEADTGIFVIVTNPKKENIQLAMQLGIKNIVIWPAISSELSGPMSEFFSCGVEIECGPKTSVKIKDELVKLLKKFLEKENASVAQEQISDHVFYEVYDKFCDPSKASLLTEFEAVTIGKETFTPLLIGRYEAITCYKMKSIQISIK